PLGPEGIFLVTHTNHDWGLPVPRGRPSRRPLVHAHTVRFRRQTRAPTNSFGRIGLSLRRADIGFRSFGTAVPWIGGGYLGAASHLARRSSATTSSDGLHGAQLGFHFRFSPISFSARSRSPLRATISATLARASMIQRRSVNA